MNSKWGIQFIVEKLSRNDRTKRYYSYPKIQKYFLYSYTLPCMQQYVFPFSRSKDLWFSFNTTLCYVTFEHFYRQL